MRYRIRVAKLEAGTERARGHDGGTTIEIQPGFRKLMTNMRCTAPLTPTCMAAKGAAKQGVFEIQVKWMTVKQVSVYLQVSVAKVYQMAQSSEIPCCRLGQQWRFEREEIDRWLRRTMDARRD